MTEAEKATAVFEHLTRERECIHCHKLFVPHKKQLPDVCLRYECIVAQGFKVLADIKELTFAPKTANTPTQKRASTEDLLLAAASTPSPG